MEPLEWEKSWKAVWVQPRSLERLFELRTSAGVHACLAFRSAFGTLAVAETFAGTWSFKRVGFFNPHVSVRRAGCETDIARFFPKIFGGGVLKWTDGAEMKWDSRGFLRQEWVFSDLNNAPLVQFHSGIEDQKLTDLLKTQLTVEIPTEGHRHPELIILLGLGLYLVLMQQQEAAAVIAAST